MSDAFNGENLLVTNKRCNQCLFSNAKVVDEQRKAEILEGCKRSGKYFICHKSPSETPIVCCGFYEEVPNRSCQVAKILGIVQFVQPETYMTKQKLVLKTKNWYVRKRDKVVCYIDTMEAGKVEYVTMPLLVVYTTSRAGFEKNFRAATTEEYEPHTNHVPMKANYLK